MSPDAFTEPNGFQWGSFQNAQGANIRYGHIKAAGPSKGTMIVVGGFRECIEKYFEVTRDMQARGFDVWLMDWRGQGGSDRYISAEPQKMHHLGYAEQIETLHQFTQSIVEKTDAPMFLAAHSMGGHIGLRYLKEHDGVFKAALLSSPMVDIDTFPFPSSAARAMVKFAKNGGNLDKYVPGGGDFKDEEFAGNKRTNDADRYQAGMNIFMFDKPELKMGDPTYGWVHHTFESVDVLNDESYLKSIKTPILMGIAGDEKIVSKEAEERAANLLPQCKRIDFPGAKHEIWMETDAVRQRWFAEVDGFLARCLKPSAPAPKNSGPKPL